MVSILLVNYLPILTLALINSTLLFYPWFAGETEPTIFERALQCFDDHNVSHDGSLLTLLTECILLVCDSECDVPQTEKLKVYNECALELRLGVEGAFHVGSESVDAYCGGACLVETKMALQCVEEIADGSFRFSNGASVLAVREALSTGCGYTPERGT